MTGAWIDPLALDPDERAATLEDRYAQAKALAQPDTIERTTAVTVTIDGTTHRHEDGRDWIDVGDAWFILDRLGYALASYPTGQGAIIRREVQG